MTPVIIHIFVSRVAIYCVTPLPTPTGGNRSRREEEDDYEDDRDRGYDNDDVPLEGTIRNRRSKFQNEF